MGTAYHNQTQAAVRSFVRYIVSYFMTGDFVEIVHSIYSVVICFWVRSGETSGDDRRDERVFHFSYQVAQ